MQVFLFPEKYSGRGEGKGICREVILMWFVEGKLDREGGEGVRDVGWSADW